MMCKVKSVKDAAMKLLLFTLLSFFVMSTAASATAPVAMVCSLRGSPEARSDAGWKPVRLLQKLRPGDSVRCGAGASATIVLFTNGDRYSVDAAQTAVVKENAVTGARALAALRGPSARVAQALQGQRYGAVVSRNTPSRQRLDPTGPGWMVAGERHFTWLPLPGAASYTFTLIDRYDNVVWSASTTGAVTADYPATLPPLRTEYPYVWKLAGFGAEGKPVEGGRWGILTFLTKADAEKLTGEIRELQGQIKENPGDLTFLFLLAELYRSHGVVERTIETLEDTRLSNEPGIEEAKQEAYAEISRYAQALGAPTASE